MKRIFVFFQISLLLLISLAAFPQKVSAADNKFSTLIKREFFVQPDFTVKVKETEIITNNTQNLYIPKGSNKNFEILAIEEGGDGNQEILQKSLDTVSLTYNQGLPFEMTKAINGDIATVSISFPADLNAGETIEFVFEYTHFGMIEKNGALSDIFLNGFSETSVFEDDRNVTEYYTDIFIPTDFPEENFVVPATYTEQNVDGYRKYSFNKQDLIGNYIWIQLGTRQYYKFQIEQKINPSEELNTGNQNRYEIVIPRSIEESNIRQTIYYTRLDPRPEWVKLDDEGNLIASFKVRSNKETTVTLEGYAMIEMKDHDQNGVKNFGQVSDIDTLAMSKYLKPAQYWEVDDSQIVEQAKEINQGKTDMTEIIYSTYNFVIDRIDYSLVKRFGINERQGAVATLNGGAAVCMEYSDLFLTLMRAQGIPARAAFGYGYDPKLKEDGQEAHQWVEVFSPALDEWVGVDVTWGETGDAIIGGDLNHFYTHVAAMSPNDPPGIVSFGFGNLELENAKYSIEVLEEVEEDESFLTEDELLEKYEYSENATGSMLLDTLNSKLEAFWINITEGNTLTKEQIFFAICLVTASILFLIAIVRLAKNRIKKIQTKEAQ